MRKAVAVSIIFFVIGISVIPSTANMMMGKDDTTPPITTCTLDPPEPDGQNGWYVSDVTITLNATDNESGVNITKYRIDEAAWETYTEPFILSNDGDDILIEYFSIDTAGNSESAKNATVNIDQTIPSILLDYTVEGNALRGYKIIFNATASDKMSSMNRVEFYYNDFLQETVLGQGPEYLWVCFCPKFSATGLIRHLEITDDYVKFYAIVVKIRHLWDFWNHLTKKAGAYDNAGNSNWAEIYSPSHPVVIEPGFYLFQNVTLTNNYTGHIGRFFIMATFNNMNGG
ncbi:MAG: hypothetical protein WC525_07485 [Candidatus Thermoplasmatota archaeon]